MPPYQAQRQSLFGETGGPAPPTSSVDIPGAIDAATRGATSLIHQSVLRKQIQNQIASEQARVSIEQQRANDERDYRAKELERQTTADRINAMTKGYIPASTTVDYTPPPPPNFSANTTAIGQAMLRGMNPGGPQPGPTMSKPSAVDPNSIAPPAAPPGSNLKITTTPEGYDATRNATYVRTMDKDYYDWQQRQQMQADKDAASAKRSTATNASREKIAGMRVRAQGDIKSQMTGDARHKALVGEAQSILENNFGGDVNAFDNYIRTDPDGRAWAAEAEKHKVGDALSIIREAHANYITAQDRQLQQKLANPNTTVSTAVSKQKAGNKSAGVGAGAGRKIGKPPGLDEQRTDYDAASAALSKQGKKPADIIAALGERP